MKILKHLKNNWKYEVPQLIVRLILFIVAVNGYAGNFWLWLVFFVAIVVLELLNWQQGYSTASRAYKNWLEL